MGTNTINAVIKLRGDTLANWNSNTSKTLQEYEPIVVKNTDSTYDFKLGTGGTYTNTAFLKINQLYLKTLKSASGNSVITIPTSAGSKYLPLTVNGNSATSGGAITVDVGVTSFNGNTGAVTGVASFNGNTGAVTGVASFNGNTGAITGVSSVNGQTGDVTVTAEKYALNNLGTVALQNADIASPTFTQLSDDAINVIAIAPTASGKALYLKLPQPAEGGKAREFRIFVKNTANYTAMMWLCPYGSENTSGGVSYAYNASRVLSGGSEYNYGTNYYYRLDIPANISSMYEFVEVV